MIPAEVWYCKHQGKFDRQTTNKIALNPSLTCDVITTSLKSHVSHLIHLITLFEAIPIDCYLDQVWLLKYICAKYAHFLLYIYLSIYISYLVPHFTNFTKNTLKTRNFDYP